jgi:diguanylate cyclase (GGDEF)-like protein
MKGRRVAERRNGARALTVYVTSLTLFAVATFVLCFVYIGSPPVGSRWPELCLFIAMVCLCEVKPISVARSSGIKEIVASTTFTFALFLAFGPVLALLAQAVASLLGDLFAKKSPIKLLFNLVQYWAAWGMAALVFICIEGRHHFGELEGGNWRWSAGVVAAGLTYFLTNNMLVGLAIALSSGNRMSRLIGSIVVEEVISDCVLLALSPIVIIVADRSLIFLPLLLLPVYAVYRSASISVEKEHQALHDSLTDLPNRFSFEETLQRRLNQPFVAARKGAVLLIDLDRFKEVNDTLGHHAGDELLRLIGPRIVEIVPSTGVVARFGGDEFAVLLGEVADETEAKAMAAEIGKVLQEPFSIDEFQLEVQASIGVAIFPDDGHESDVLIKRADIAMYVAKRLQSGVETYDPLEDHHSTRRLGLVSELRKAVADGEIILHYQPKLDLDNGQVAAAEALVRWVHPELGIVPPSEFIPVAEHTGLIGPLTTHVLSTAVRQAARWREQGRDLVISVNLSARNLHDSGLVHEVAETLARFRLPARLLRLEITESSIMADTVRARRILEQLHEMGVGLSIDDFGTGYSSLAYLQNLPVSEIKIDQSFVANLVDSPASQVIVRSTIDLARNLGLTSTAEGVETAQALQWLRDAGCDEGQGYHIARPMTVDALELWLDTRDVEGVAERTLVMRGASPN